MKTLYIDIETAPNVGVHYGLFDQNLSPKHILEPSYVMCAAWQWRHKKRVHFVSEFHNGREEMVRSIHQVLDEADMVVHYYGKRFDIPHLNRAMNQLYLPPPSPFFELDLLTTIRRKFKFPSTKLEYVVQELGVGKKLDSGGIGNTIACMQGDPKAWARMRRYNIGDVVVLQPLHDRIMPWLVAAPNARITNGNVCPVCGEGELRREGYAFTAQGSKYQRYQCKRCNAWSRDTRRVEGANIRGMP